MSIYIMPLTLSNDMNELEKFFRDSCEEKLFAVQFDVYKLIVIQQGNIQ